MLRTAFLVLFANLIALVCFGCRWGYEAPRVSDEGFAGSGGLEECLSNPPACRTPDEPCQGEQCEPLMCTFDEGDCDGEASNGCETPLDTTSDCGACGVSCDLAGAISVCVDGQCMFAACEEDHADCDGDLANGCETPLDTLSNCGACGRSCEHPGATFACNGGVCEVVECEPGRADCDGDPENGCEHGLDSLSSCGACGRACHFASATASCGDGVCELISCASGFDDCDEDEQNGCETPLGTVSDCAACGEACSFSHGVASCVSGACELIGCAPGFEDCDNDPQNGCETPLDTLTDCGGCGVPCEIAGSDNEGCTGGVCSTMACSAPYADCDSDGLSCETTLTTLQDCGSCGTPCELAHAGESCSTGSCTLTTCDTGWDNCDGSDANGCETDLSAVGDCGSCRNACPSGDVCVNEECATPFAAYTPFNIVPKPPTLGTQSVLSLACGSVSIDTSTLTADTWCGAPAPLFEVQTQAGGPDVAVLVVRGLNVAAGTTVSVRGSRPFAIAAFGDVIVDGVLDVSAAGTVSGPGRDWQCSTSLGIDGGGTSLTGGDGGGGGGFAQKGGDGGRGGLLGTTPSGGVARGAASISPLVPGCHGGAGGGCSGGGGGGGALQISAAGNLIVGGSLRANGGSGPNGCGLGGGGSGGGSGGAILLEGQTVVISGGLFAKGGAGGRGALGGDGGAESTVGAGQNGDGSLLGGGGGGAGAVGRIRVFATTSCTVGGTRAPSVSESCP